MSYSFGWWDFVEGAEPALVNRYSGERVVCRGPLPPGDAPKDEPWLRFDYFADDLTYPLAVRWAPERGEIVLDHNVSAAIWRRETGATAEAPPFGTFVRVDDIVPDALWCWPGVIDLHFERLVDEQAGGRHPIFHRGASPLTMFRLGGYSNGAWREELVSEEANDVRFSALDQGSMGSIWSSPSYPGTVKEMSWLRGEFAAAYSNARQYAQRVVLTPTAPPPSPLVFVDPISSPDSAGDYPDWMRKLLSDEPLSKDGHWRTNAPRIPHAVSRDRTRLITHPGTEVVMGHGPIVKWDLPLHVLEQTFTCAEVVPSRERWFGPYTGSRYHKGTSWVCGLNCLRSTKLPSPSGFVRLCDYDEWLKLPAQYGHAQTTPDVSFQKRDLIDALLLFVRVADRGFAQVSDRDQTLPQQQKFDCIASPTRLLGGRLVGSRVKFNYFKQI